MYTIEEALIIVARRLNYEVNPLTCEKIKYIEVIGPTIDVKIRVGDTTPDDVLNRIKHAIDVCNDDQTLAKWPDPEYCSIIKSIEYAEVSRYPTTTNCILRILRIKRGVWEEIWSNNKFN